MEEIVVPILGLGIHLLFWSHIEIVGIIYVLLLIYREVGCEVDVYLTCLLSILGGYNDDTIGCTGTIDGIGCGILQYVYALDVIWVQIVDVSLYRYAIHYQQWGGFGIERGGTTNSHLSIISGKTCHATFEVVHDVGGVTLVQFG